MFSSKKSKQQAINTVDNLLTTYLQTTDKKIAKSKQKAVKKGRKNGQHEATTILNMNAQVGNFKQNKADLKKFKEKERKLRNKELKRYKVIEEKIQRQSKLENGDENEINTVLEEKVSKITAVDKYLNDDEDLHELQEDVLSFSTKQPTKEILKEITQKEQLAAKRRNAKLEDFNRKISRGHIAVAGLTPGLAQPGDDDTDSDEDDDDEVDDGSNLDNFKDDFDDYN
ncbi:hypothetical protein CANINC_002646 [Pichia inconspicua]|uniref:Regulator of rDNA transcription 14 n=1 Tax=Pichia inconspicua TaxID=52247 RepID=A0A4T0X0P9_9ASCO|nr:hypothetical protein CANINC_002646 [[Candida] inconspicua]